MRLRFTPHTGLCRKCGRDAIGLDGEFLCEDCRVHRPHFDRVASVLRFEGEARELVNSFKFREGLHLAPDLVDWLEALARVHFKLDEIDAIVPIPATLGHRWLRGYNQCAVLASGLSKRLSKPARPLLRRIGHPRRQGLLREDERRKNVLGTFACRVRESSAFRTVLLVDDIMTTGSTLSEAAKTLKAGGVERVWGLTLTRSLRF